MSYVFQPYPKWVAARDGSRVIVANEEAHQAKLIEWGTSLEGSVATLISAPVATIEPIPEVVALATATPPAHEGEPARKAGWPKGKPRPKKVPAK